MPMGKIYISAPKRGYTKKGKPRRTTTRRLNTVNTAKNIARAGPSTRMLIKMPYSEQLSGKTTTTSLGVYQFRSNGLYDPNYTEAGHQPLWRDQMVQLYNDYRVHAVKFDVEFSLNTSVTAIVGIGYADALSSVPTAIGQVVESSKFKTRIINEVNPIRLSWYLTQAKIFGKGKKRVSTEKDYAAGVGNDPVNVGNLMVIYQNIDKTTSTSFNFNVKLTYYTIYNTPTLVAMS